MYYSRTAVVAAGILYYVQTLVLSESRLGNRLSRCFLFHSAFFSRRPSPSCTGSARPYRLSAPQSPHSGIRHLLPIVRQDLWGVRGCRGGIGFDHLNDYDKFSRNSFLQKKQSQFDFTFNSKSFLGAYFLNQFLHSLSFPADLQKVFVSEQTWW